MAALIASPKKHFTQNVMYTYGKTNKSQSFLCVVSHFSLCLFFKNIKRKKKNFLFFLTKKVNQKRTKAKQKDWSLQSVWEGPWPSDSQFTVQNSSK